MQPAADPGLIGPIDILKLEELPGLLGHNAHQAFDGARFEWVGWFCLRLLRVPALGAFELMLNRLAVPLSGTMLQPPSPVTEIVVYLPMLRLHPFHELGTIAPYAYHRNTAAQHIIFADTP